MTFSTSASTCLSALFLLLFASLLPQAPSQSAPGFRDALKAFETGIKSRDEKKRVAAIREFSRCQDPQAVSALLDHVVKFESKMSKARKRYESLGKKINQTLAKRLDGKKVLTVNDVAAVEKKIAPWRKEHAALSEQIASSEEAQAACQVALGTIVSSLDSEGQQSAVGVAVQSIDRATKEEVKAGLLLACAEIDHDLIAQVAISTVQTGKTPGVRVAALETMLPHPRESVEPCAIAALEDEFWPVRSAAIAVLRKIGGKAAVPALIEALDREEGRLITELMGCLKTITKVDHHDNAPLWREWWAKNQKSFSGRGGRGAVASGDADPKPGSKAKDGKGTYFYGIETRSKHILYVLDISGSMNWDLATQIDQRANGPLPPPAEKGSRKLDSAIKELLASISSLPDDGTFNIIHYSSEVGAWKKKMQTSTSSTKTKARAFADGLEAVGATNIFDALERAFKMAGRGAFDKRYGIRADTIFFLSDGVANRGRVTETAQMLREVKHLNELSRVQIHTVALGKGADTAFMKALAAQNDGQFAHIEK